MMLSPHPPWTTLKNGLFKAPMKSPVSVFDPSAFPLIHQPVSGPLAPPPSSCTRSHHASSQIPREPLTPLEPIQRAFEVSPCICASTRLIPARKYDCPISSPSHIQLNENGSAAASSKIHLRASERRSLRRLSGCA